MTLYLILQRRFDRRGSLIYLRTAPRLVIFSLIFSSSIICSIIFNKIVLYYNITAEIGLQNAHISRFIELNKGNGLANVL